MKEAIISYPYVIESDQLGMVNERNSQYVNEKVLGVGFTRRTGLGYVLGVNYAHLDAELMVGGSSESSVQLALRNYERRGRVDPKLLSGFSADLRDSAQIDNAVTGLKKPPSIVIYASATGMEGFFLPMSEYLLEMNLMRESGEVDAEAKIAEKKEELRHKLEIWVPEHYPDALAVNRTAPEYLIERLVDRFGDPFRFVYINSSFGFKGAGPIHYSNVYQTKQQMSAWMTENAEKLVSQGVEMHEEIDPVIYDTDVGESIIDDISPHWPERIQRVVNETKVNRQDVFGSVKLYTDMTVEQRTSRPKPNRHFLVTRSGVATVLEYFPEELEMDTKEFNF